MAMHLEFVIPGPPISNQQRASQGKATLATWRATVAGEARKQWAKPILTGKLKAIIINFHLGKKPSVDLDNMSKPILEAMEKIIYVKDRQIKQAEISHVRIDAPFVFVGGSKRLVAAVQAGSQFVSMRIEDPVRPLPLPK